MRFLAHILPSLHRSKAGVRSAHDRPWMRPLQLGRAGGISLRWLAALGLFALLRMVDGEMVTARTRGQGAAPIPGPNPATAVVGDMASHGANAVYVSCSLSGTLRQRDARVGPVIRWWEASPTAR